MIGIYCLILSLSSLDPLSSRRLFAMPEPKERVYVVTNKLWDKPPRR